MYLFIFIILSVLSLIFKEKKISNTSLFLLIFTFTAFVGLRGDDVDNDYKNYQFAIEINNTGIAEITFKSISHFLYKIFHSSVIVFVLYAILGVGLKFIAFKKYSNYFWLTILIYFSTFFILQEMNAIRAGAASGFVLLGLKPWSEGKKKAALLLIIIAGLFHYSFFVLLPFLFIISNNNKHNNILIYIGLIPIAYILYPFLDIGIVSPYINNPYILGKMSGYLNSFESTDVFSTVFLIKILFILLLYFFRKKLDSYPYFYLFLKLYCIGIFFVVIFANFPAASMRFMDIFIIVELFLIPLFCNLFPSKFKFIPILLIILYSYFYFYLYVNVGEYIRPYSLIIKQ